MTNRRKGLSDAFTRREFRPCREMPLQRDLRFCIQCVAAAPHQEAACQRQMGECRICHDRITFKQTERFPAELTAAASKLPVLSPARHIAAAIGCANGDSPPVTVINVFLTSELGETLDDFVHDGRRIAFSRLHADGPHPLLDGALVLGGFGVVYLAVAAALGRREARALLRGRRPR